MQREAGAVNPMSVSSWKRGDGVGKEGAEAAKEKEEKKVETKTKITSFVDAKRKDIWLTKVVR